MAADHVIVSVADHYLDRFPEVAQHLKEAGLQVDQELRETGVLTGTIDSSKTVELSRIPGVEAVEPERDYQLAPPDSDIQ